MHWRLPLLQGQANLDLSHEASPGPPAPCHLRDTSDAGGGRGLVKTGEGGAGVSVSHKTRCSGGGSQGSLPLLFPLHIPPCSPLPALRL